MNRSPGKLLEAFLAVRQGEFERAFELAEKEIKINPEQFWGWYLAAVALGFLDRRSAFGHYLDRAGLLNANSPFIVYLRAYSHLWKNDLESALMEWTKLVDLDEGWLARNLIEKARKGTNLVEKASKGEISFFIVLPDFIEGISRNEQEQIGRPYPGQTGDYTFTEEPFSKSRTGDQKKSIKFKKLKLAAAVLAALAVISGFVFIFKDPVLNYVASREDLKNPEWRNFKIDEWAALVNPQKKENARYVYKVKDKLIEDFELAKTKLSDKKFNQARFLLQRIIYSNADFKTKEKSKIFLSFIPEPDYQDFSDPVFPDKLLETPEFFADCLVLWQGSVLKIREVDNGKEVSLLIKDSGSDYLVDAFLQGKESRSNWLPFADFQKKKELTEKKPQAIVYGKFKGVIGKQKKIYLELVQLWM